MLGDRYQVVYLTGCQPECRQEAKNGQWENDFYTETLQQQITHGVTETANAFDEDMHNAIQAGMNGYLAKPLDVNKLYDMMRQCLK